MSCKWKRIRDGTFLSVDSVVIILKYSFMYRAAFGVSSILPICASDTSQPHLGGRKVQRV